MIEYSKCSLGEEVRSISPLFPEDFPHCYRRPARRSDRSPATSDFYAGRQLHGFPRFGQTSMDLTKNIIEPAFLSLVTSLKTIIILVGREEKHRRNYFTPEAGKCT